MDNNSLPVDLFHWAIAILPLILLLIMLVVLKWSGSVSGWLAMAVAAVIGFTLFRAPLDGILIGFGKGLWEAFFILLVVWPAILLYNVTKSAHAFAAIREGIQEHTQNYLFLVLAFGWVFASFLQGIAGFGAPIAVVAPLLVGLGVKPIMAVVIPLIGHAWANMFGTLAVGWLATINVVNIENVGETVLYTTLLLWVPNLIAGFMICYLFGKWKGIKEGFIAVITISIIHGGGQVLLGQVNPTLSAFIPATVALLSLFGLAKMKRYSEKTELQEETEILDESAMDKGNNEESNMSIHKAAMPYYFLTVISIIALGIPFIIEILAQVEWGPAFSGFTTGYDYQVGAESPYSPISPLTHPGLYLLIASIFGYFWFKKQGAYEEDAGKEILSGVKDNAVGATLSIIGFLTMTQIMSDTGQTSVIALGIAAVSPPVVYIALSNVIGIIGAFMTSSNTASNVLFSPLHVSVAESMGSVTTSQVIASQSVGGAIGNSIAPANVILGTSTTGLEGKESEVLKYTIVFTVVSAVIVSGLAVALFYLG